MDLCTSTDSDFWILDESSSNHMNTVSVMCDCGVCHGPPAHGAHKVWWIDTLLFKEA